MSEVVVRMEMPSGCHDCKLRSMVGNCPIPMFDGYDEKKIWTLEECFQRPPWCPVICALPENHGRLGELDELERKVNAARIRVMQSGGDTNPYWECGDLILQTPTIVPATEGGKHE